MRDIIDVVRAFFQRLDAGERYARTLDLAKDLSAGELQAFRAAGMLRPASRVGTRPCDEPRKVCYRNVSVAKEGSPGPFVGVCREPKGGCMVAYYAEQDLAREELSLHDTVRALRVLYDVDDRETTIPSHVGKDPITLGWLTDAGGERRVVLLAGPMVSLSLVLHDSRRSLVLLPTDRQLTPELRAKHGAEAFIAMETLLESITVHDGRLARAALGVLAPDAPSLARAITRPPPLDAEPTKLETRSAPLHPPPAKPSAKANVPAASQSAVIPGLVRWSQLRLCRVDKTTIRADFPGFCKRMTHIDLGMAHKQNRRPTEVWKMLVQLCEDHGEIRSKSLGKFETGQKVVSRLRSALKELFGKDEDPFRRYGKDLSGWRARFVAQPDVPEDFEDDPRRRASSREDAEDGA